MQVASWFLDRLWRYKMDYSTVGAIVAVIIVVIVAVSYSKRKKHDD